MEELPVRPEEKENTNKDSLCILAETLIKEGYCKDRYVKINEIHFSILDIWLRQIYMYLLNTYDVSVDTFIYYTYHVTEKDANQFFNKELLEKYMLISKKWFNLMTEILNRQFGIKTDKKNQQLHEFYTEEKGFDNIQWERMNDSIKLNDADIFDKLQETPILFMEALQLQYIFGVQTLPSDFTRRISLLTDNQMLFANTEDGEPHNYVLFKGFNKHPLQIITPISFEEFCQFLEYMIDGENGYLRLQRICDNLITQTINGIAYRNSFKRNAENQQMRKSISSVMELIVENQDFFPEIMEEFEPQEQWFKYGNESFKAKVLNRKNIPEITEDEEKKPKKEKTVMDEFRVLNKFKDILEAHFAKIRKTKNQPKNSIVDAGFIEN